MSVVITCAGCGVQLRVPAHGVTYRCPRCKHVGRAEAEASQAATPDAPLASLAQSVATVPRSSTKERPQSRRIQPIVWIGLAAAVLLVVAIVIAVIFLLPSDIDEPIVATGPQPSPAAEGASEDSVTGPTPPPALQPLPPDQLGWYHRYLASEAMMAFYVRPSRIVQSRVFREGTAPVSLQLQLFLSRPQLGGTVVPMLAEEWFFVLTKGTEGLADLADLNVVRTAQPIAKLPDGDTVEYGGKQYVLAQASAPNQALPLPVGQLGNNEQPLPRAFFKLDESTIVVGNEKLVRWVIDGTPGPNGWNDSVGIGLAALESPQSYDLLVLVDVKAFLQFLQGVMSTMFAGPQAAAGQSGGPQMVPGPGSLRPNQAGIDWLILGATFGDTAKVDLAVVASDPQAAFGLQMQVGQLKGTLPGTIQELIEGQQGKADQQALVEGLQALKSSLEQMSFNLRDRVVLASVELSGKAIAALITAGMQTMVQRQAARGPQGTPDASSSSGGAFPDQGGFPGFPGTDGFPKDTSAESEDK